MEEYLELGSAPADENCVQVETGKDYVPAMLAECKRYKELLRKLFPDKPDDCRFAIKSFPHDFGTYYEVVIFYNPKIEKSANFAFSVESNLPAKWETADQRTRQFQVQTKDHI